MALRLSTVAHTISGDGVGRHVLIATTGILEGDLVFVFFNADGDSNLNDANFTPDPGFTAPAAGLNTQSAPDGSSYRVCYKVSTASEPAEYDFTNTAYATMYPMMVVLSGRDGTVTIGTWNTNTTGNSSVISTTYNAYTAATGDDVLALASLDKSNFDATWDFSDIAGFTTAVKTDGSAHGGGWESSMFAGLLANASAGLNTPTQDITNLTGGGTAGYANLIIQAPAASSGSGGDGAASGASSVDGVSKAMFVAAGTAASVTSVSGNAKAILSANGQAASSSGSTGISSALVGSVGSSSSSSVAVGSGSSSIQLPADGNAQGASTTSGQSSTVHSAVGDSDTTVTVAGFSGASVGSVGASLSVSISLGVSPEATADDVNSQWPYHEIADNILSGKIPAGPDSDIFIKISRRGLRRGR